MAQDHKESSVRIGLKEATQNPDFYKITVNSKMIPSHFTKALLTFDEKITSEEASRIAKIMAYYSLTKSPLESPKDWEFLESHNAILLHFKMDKFLIERVLVRLTHDEHNLARLTENLKMAVSMLPGYFKDGSPLRLDSTRQVDGIHRDVRPSLWINGVENPEIAREVDLSAVGHNTGNIMYKNVKEMTAEDIIKLQELTQYLSMENNKIKEKARNLSPALREVLKELGGMADS